MFKFDEDTYRELAELAQRAPTVSVFWKGMGLGLEDEAEPDMTGNS